MAHRARIILASADGQSVRAMARRLGLSIDTVCLWRKRFQEEGLDGLRSRSLPGRRSRIGPRRERAIVLAAAAPPSGAPTSSVAAVARSAGVSRATVRRLWEREGGPTASAEDAALEEAPPRGVQPGTIVAIYVDPDRSSRALVRVKPSAGGSPPAAGGRRGAGPSACDGEAIGVILTALEAFVGAAAEAAPLAPGHDRPLLATLRRVSGALPRVNLEIAAERGLLPRDRAVEAELGADRRWLRFIASRTRGQWLARAARWFSACPIGQETALAGALGHLTDYFATWRAGSAPFIWLHAPTEASGRSPTPRRRGAVEQSTT
jgi:transposase